MCRRVLPARLVLLALVAAAAPALAGGRAAVQLRCTEFTEGELTGTEHDMDSIELPAGQRRYNFTVDNDPQACLVAGVVVTACDVLPPQVSVSEDLSTARVLRLGPLWLPLLVEVTRYCSPEPTTLSTTPSTIPATTPSTTTAAYTTYRPELQSTITGAVVDRNNTSYI